MNYFGSVTAKTIEIDCWLTLPERRGQRLRVIARGKMNSALVEFEDGTRHIVNRWSFRKVPCA